MYTIKDRRYDMISQSTDKTKNWDRKGQKGFGKKVFQPLTPEHKTCVQHFCARLLVYIMLKSFTTKCWTG